MRFIALEDRLQAANRVHVVFEIESTEPNPSTLRGQLIWGPDGTVRLDANGSFAGDPVEIHLFADGSRMTGTAGDTTIDLPWPIDLKGSLMIGLTRMGLLHNLAMLAGGRAPDHADGTVEEWARTIALASMSPGSRQERDRVRFWIEVAGERVGRVILQLRPGDVLPVRREQDVHFADQTMHVTERYETFVVEP